MRMLGGDMFGTITKVRRGYIGYNQFVPVIVLAWFSGKLDAQAKSA